ncbi:MAG TPA: MoaD/ThiS family protein [Ilumatobacteraceae bacterium]|nr:MoaD/ThiS family protein [Ilumatobacteraceae bacterium]
MRIQIPTPLRSYTAGEKYVDATGVTLDDLLVDLDRRFPGIRFRVVDEQGRLRAHMRIFVNRAIEAELSRPISGDDEVVLMQALSGG